MDVTSCPSATCDGLQDRNLTHKQYCGITVWDIKRPRAVITRPFDNGRCCECAAIVHCMLADCSWTLQGTDMINMDHAAQAPHTACPLFDMKSHKMSCVLNALHCPMLICQDWTVIGSCFVRRIPSTCRSSQAANMVSHHKQMNDEEIFDLSVHILLMIAAETCTLQASLVQAWIQTIWG